MKNKKRKIRPSSDIYSGNSEENFTELMAQHFVLKHAQWDLYHKARMLNDVNGALKALKRIQILLEQEVEILIRFGKIVPLS